MAPPQTDARVKVAVLLIIALGLQNSFAQEDKAKPAPTEIKSIEVDPLTGEKIIKVPHPGTAEGLESVSTDKAYHYAVPMREKKRGSTAAVNILSAPNITSQLPNGTQITYSSMYGSGSLLGLTANYEWMPFKKYGTFALVFESGISTAHGNGYLQSGERALESYALYIIPLTFLAKYRFEYKKKQFIVPYVEGGLTYYGFAEIRDDGDQNNFAGSEAAVGGGGFMFNVARFDKESSFALDREYNIADMYVIVGARQIIGLKQSLNMTNTDLMIGVTVDY